MNALLTALRFVYRGIVLLEAARIIGQIVHRATRRTGQRQGGKS